MGERTGFILNIIIVLLTLILAIIFIVAENWPTAILFSVITLLNIVALILRKKLYK